MDALVHAVLALPMLVLPGEHVGHVVEPAALKRPAPQGAQGLPKTGEAVPAGQFWQKPLLSTYWPSAQVAPARSGRAGVGRVGWEHRGRVAISTEPGTRLPRCSETGGAKKTRAPAWGGAGSFVCHTKFNVRAGHRVAYTRQGGPPRQQRCHLPRSRASRRSGRLRCPVKEDTSSAFVFRPPTPRGAPRVAQVLPELKRMTHLEPLLQLGLSYRHPLLLLAAAF
jgi:hypothetical protein